MVKLSRSIFNFGVLSLAGLVTFPTLRTVSLVATFFYLPTLLFLVFATAGLEDLVVSF